MSRSSVCDETTCEITPSSPFPDLSDKAVNLAVLLKDKPPIFVGIYLMIEAISLYKYKKKEKR